jgi:hypothetical protein
VAEVVPKREGEAGTSIGEREARRRRTMINIKKETRRMAAMTPPAIPPASNTDDVDVPEGVERLAMPMDVWNVLLMRSIKKMLEII